MTKKISQLTSASSAAATDLFETESAGGSSFKTTALQIATYMATALASVFAAIGTTITGAGLATGGGSLAANRTITVTAASDAQAIAQAAATVALTPANAASRPAFICNKTADQATISSTTWTKVTWPTEVVDNGSYFASDKWTPPASGLGLCRITAQVLVFNATPTTRLLIGIYKNGSQHRVAETTYSAGGYSAAFISALVQQNGTDYFEIYVNGTSAGTLTVVGDATENFFMGEML